MAAQAESALWEKYLAVHLTHIKLLRQDRQLAKQPRCMCLALGCLGGEPALAPGSWLPATADPGRQTQVFGLLPPVETWIEFLPLNACRGPGRRVKSL